MKTDCLKYLRDIQLMKNYFAMLESFGSTITRGELYDRAGESVFLGGVRARQLITQLLKNKEFMKCLRDEIGEE